MPSQRRRGSKAQRATSILDLRLQYLAGQALKRLCRCAYFGALVGDGPSAPARHFTGTPAKLGELRQRLRGAAATTDASALLGQQARFGLLQRRTSFLVDGPGIGTCSCSSVSLTIFAICQRA